MQSEDFLKNLAVEALSQPDRAAELAIMRQDPAFAAGFAAQLASEALGRARKAIEKSEASIVFEALITQNKKAMADGIEATYGREALEELLAENPGAIPARALSTLSAWIFPDGSFLSCSRQVDSGFADFCSALASSKRFLSCVGASKASQAARAGALAASSPHSAFPSTREALLAMLEGFGAPGGAWRQGMACSDIEGRRSIELQELKAAAMEACHKENPLDAAMAKALEKKAARLIEEAAAKP